jgi:hypothetical protein
MASWDALYRAWLKYGPHVVAEGITLFRKRTPVFQRGYVIAAPVNGLALGKASKDKCANRENCDQKRQTAEASNCRSPVAIKHFG